MKTPAAKRDHPWPTLDSAALHGLAGDFVRSVEPHTEADSVALLLQILLGFGNALGPKPHFVVEGTRHGLNEFAVLVGRTSKARKGTSLGRVRQVMKYADEGWEAGRIASGLSSGEGLIFHVRDATEKCVKGELVVDDPGVNDKRILIVEPEFASLLRVIAREGNTLSPIVRRAWDGDVLRTLTKNSPLRATGAHVSIIGHVTTEEVRRELTRTEIANGFANRFMWLCVRRSKLLPDGGTLDEETLRPLATRFGSALELARTFDEIRRDEESRRIWAEVYPTLSADRPGLFGAICARAEAHVLRLPCLYAVLDGSGIIRRPHLEAALAVWDYAEASARFIFGDSLGDPDADTIYRSLRTIQEGMTRTEIHALFGRHRSEGQIDAALALLLSHSLVSRTSSVTAGRTAERWFAR
ncbi:MAG: DUF3987 domain-containing protein [Nitrospirae bacterium]|nr:DUF3987 domain-containing protein [Nitrospirota bacterium]